MPCHRKIFVSLLAAVAISSGDTGEAVQTSAVLRLRRQTASSERVPPDGRATIARLSMVPAAIPAASVSARVAADAPVAAMRPAAAGALSQRRSFVGARGVRDRRRRATRASTPVVRASLGGSISPDLNFTEEAFTVPLDRVALGAFVSISVRADATPEAAIDALVAVVRVHAPGEVQLQWGLGSENPDGSISRDPWECPPEALMPPARTSSTAGPRARRCAPRSTQPARCTSPSPVARATASPSSSSTRTRAATTTTAPTAPSSSTPTRPPSPPDAPPPPPSRRRARKPTACATYREPRRTPPPRERPNPPVSVPSRTSIASRKTRREKRVVVRLSRNSPRTNA